MDLIAEIYLRLLRQRGKVKGLPPENLKNLQALCIAVAVVEPPVQEEALQHMPEQVEQVEADLVGNSDSVAMLLPFMEVAGVEVATGNPLEVPATKALWSSAPTNREAFT